MQINITYDASAEAAPPGFTTAVQAAVSYFEQTFSSPITVNINVGWGEVGGQAIDAGALAESLTQYVGLNYEYGVQALVNIDTAPALEAALHALPTPPASTAGILDLPYAEARLLGQAPTYPGVSDGSIGLDSTAAWTFDPNNRAVPGAYDAIGAIEHEISEVLGRQAFDGGPALGYQTALTPLDFFRVDASGNHLYTPGGGYLTLNGDQLLLPLNDPANGGDAGDWAASVGADAFGAFGETGVAATLSAVDVRVMQLLGYQVSSTAPTPDGVPVTPDTLTADTQVGAGQTQAFDGPFAILMGFVPGGAAVNFTNAGAVIDTGLRSQIDVVGVSPAQQDTSLSSTFSNLAGASLRVTATAQAADAVGVYWGPSVNNAGLISVTSDQADAWGIVGDPFQNAAGGVLSVSAADHAIGVDLTGSGGGPFANAGTITVQGATAVGVQGMSAFTNSGTLTATAANGASIGVWVVAPFATSFTNTGVITADTALLVDSRTFGNAFPNVNLTNSGQINGAVVLANAADNEVHNTGSIAGRIVFGDGGGVYDGAAGRQSGGVYLGDGNYTVTLGADGESVFGGAGGSSTLTGGAGNDFFEIFRGASAIDGGAGTNTLSFADSDVGVSVDLGAGTASWATGSASLKNIQVVVGSAYNDTLMAGSAGAELIGGAGDDTLTGGAGNDILVASAAGALMTGGGGDNSFVYQAGDQQAVISDFGRPGAGNVLQIFGYAGAASVVQQGADTLVTLSATDSVLLKNVQAATLPAGAIAYSAGAWTGPVQPVSPPVFGSQPVRFTANLTITAAERFNIVGQPAALVDVGDGGVGLDPPFHTLDNFGQVAITTASGDVAGLTTDLSATYLTSSATLTNEAGASLSVTNTSASGQAIGLSTGGTPPVTNAGLITVSANGLAYGAITSEPSPFLNAAGGTISAASASAAAYGLDFNDGANLTNRGTITASGVGSATGVSIEQSNGSSVTNSGTITATASGPGAQSYGVVFEGFPQNANTLTNSGVITATVAIQTRRYITGTQLSLVNSGHINGVVDLSVGAENDTVTNTGVIVGAIRFGDGANTYNGAGGIQTGGLYLGPGTSTVTLGDDGESVFGGGGADTITGGAGNDFIEIGRGANTIDGGGGFNTLSFADADQGVTVNLGAGTASASGADTLRNIQEVIGSTFNDTLIAGTAAATLVAGSGHDVLTGGAGNDTLVAGAGGDVMTGGGGNDTFIYSAGDHQLVVTDFGQNGDQDVLKVFGYAAAQSVVQQGADTLITLSSADTILLKNVKVSALGAGAVAYSPAAYSAPAVPASPPPFFSTGAPMVLDYGLTVHAGETLAITSHSSDLNINQNIGLWDQTTQIGQPNGNLAQSVDNAGTVSITSADDGLWGLLSQEGLTPTFTNEAGAVWSVTDTTGAADGMLIQSSNAYSTLNNAGLIVTRAQGDASGVVVSDAAFTFSNAAGAVLRALSTTGAAIGLQVAYGGTETNAGLIDAEGVTAAYGLQEVALDGGGGFQYASFVNSGQITATASGPGGQSYGLDIGSAYNVDGPSSITNTGTITAQWAIRNEDSGSGFDPLIVTNSGVLNGVVDLGGSDSTLSNQRGGTINGNVLFAPVTLSMPLASLFGIYPPQLSNDGAINGDVVMASSGAIYNDGAISGAIRLSDGSVSLNTASGTVGGPIIIAPTVAGQATADTISTGAGASLVEITAGDSALTVNVTGGAGGQTTVRFDVASTAAGFQHNANGTWTVSAGADGTAILTDVQTVQFADRTLALPSLVTNDFAGDPLSDLLIQNASGAVVLGEVGANGQAAYSQVGALGPEWRFRGTGDFLGDGRDQFLIQNGAGSVVLASVVGGAASYSQITSLGPEWSFVGTGDYLGAGDSQFLIENTFGSVVVGALQNGTLAYTQVASLGPEWRFVAGGDFLGDGRADFLIQNAAGSVVVGEVRNGQAVYTQVSALGPEWKFVASGDFLGDGRSDFLIENGSDAVALGEVVSGQVRYSVIGALGPEWSFLGAGDFLGDGHTQFLIENAGGAVFAGEVEAGQAVYSQIGALGSEWSFRLSGGPAASSSVPAAALIQAMAGTASAGAAVSPLAPAAVSVASAAVQAYGPAHLLAGSGRFAFT